MRQPVKIKAKQNRQGIVKWDGYTYKLKFHRNPFSNIWYMSIKGVTNSVDKTGIAVLPGKNLIPQGYSDILGELWCIDNSGAGENPDFDNFGSRWTLEYYTLEASPVITSYGQTTGGEV